MQRSLTARNKHQHNAHNIHSCIHWPIDEPQQNAYGGNKCIKYQISPVVPNPHGIHHPFAHAWAVYQPAGLELGLPVNRPHAECSKIWGAISNGIYPWCICINKFNPKVGKCLNSPINPHKVTPHYMITLVVQAEKPRPFPQPQLKRAQTKRIDKRNQHHDNRDKRHQYAQSRLGPQYDRLR